MLVPPNARVYGLKWTSRSGHINHDVDHGVLVCHFLPSRLPLSTKWGGGRGAYLHVSELGRNGLDAGFSRPYCVSGHAT